MNLKDIHRVYFIGIGGIGMSALANYFSAQGKLVAGCDKVSTSITRSLKEKGIEVFYEDIEVVIPDNFRSKENTLVVRTPAVKKDHFQLQYFKNHHFKILKRSEVLGLITRNTFCFGVAGTHGKTTTSSILGHIMKSVDATSFLGGIAKNYQSNLILGKDEISVVEADEYDRSFLQLSPNIGCITSMDADHLDIYGQHDELLSSFQSYADKVSDKLIVAECLSISGITYGFSEQSDYQITDLRVKDGSYNFNVKTPSKNISEIKFSLPGKHNVMNALAALAMASEFGLATETIKERLGSFKGVIRRFSYKIKRDDLVLIDDYAHHPTEINVVFESLLELYPIQKYTVVFQPHLFSRTRDFIDDFARVLSQFDEVILLDIYPAREEPIQGVNSDWLLSKITQPNKKLVNKKDLIKVLEVSDSKIVTMLGAGDIGELVDIVKNHFEKTKNRC